MKEQIHHLESEVDSAKHVEAYHQEGVKLVNCHLKLTPAADRQLIKIQHLLRNEKIKLSKTGVINLLLENLKTECFLEDLSLILGDKLKNKIAQVFLNSDMNDEDLEILKKMEANNKNKKKV